MSCFHPLIAFPGKRTDKGKIQYVPIKKSTADLYEWYQSKEYISWKQNYKGDDCGAPILLPCGKCIGCRLDKSREWALRCMMELKENNGVAFFLTLTYNDGKIPVRYYAAPETGEALPCYSLCLDDLQKFWKRLRKAFPDVKIRYFACGEYGSDTFRPHYHAIVFGFRPSDLRIIKVTEEGNYYTSNQIYNIWAHGNVVISDVTFRTCAYVARYTAKKYLTLEDNFFESHNMEKPFLVMSRRPGIGWSYMEAHRNYFELDRIYVAGDDPVDSRLPRGFLRKLEELDPEIFEQVKERRKKYGDVYERTVAMARKVPYAKLLEDAEANLMAQAKKIQRKKV